jgi:glucose-1-phosphate thymidylyltransferase
MSTHNTKGIILAGGKGTRMYPLTTVISKQLLPVYDKPMIYYPLTTLMLAKIQDILIITDAEHLNQFQQLLGDGSQWGMNFSYATQDSPRGLADAFIVGKSFVGNDNSCLILGDNIFYSQGLGNILTKAKNRQDGATVFGHFVNDPHRFGVIEFAKSGEAISIEEKPTHPKSHYAVTGVYFYDNDVIDIAHNLQPSKREELEITDVNNHYLKNNKLYVEKLGRGTFWLDAGTHESLLEASNFVETIQNRQGLQLSCPEEIAYHNGWINADKIELLADQLGSSGYQKYLLNFVANT